MEEDVLGDIVYEASERPLHSRHIDFRPVCSTVLYV